MAVIIRLQNLPLAADSLDIREFFKGLKIPEGGVHIVGGDNGDAFIGFATDEDARQAMNLNNKKIRDDRIKLLLSSRTEMQNVILAARERQAKLIAAALNNPNANEKDIKNSKDDKSLRGHSGQKDKYAHSSSKNNGNKSISPDKFRRRKSSRSRSPSKDRDRYRERSSRHRSRSRSSSVERKKYKDNVQGREVITSKYNDYRSKKYDKDPISYITSSSKSNEAHDKSNVISQSAKNSISVPINSAYAPSQSVYNTLSKPPMPSTQSFNIPNVNNLLIPIQPNSSNLPIPVQPNSSNLPIPIQPNVNNGLITIQPNLNAQIIPPYYPPISTQNIPSINMISPLIMNPPFNPALTLSQNNLISNQPGLLNNFQSNMSYNNYNYTSQDLPNLELNMPLFFYAEIKNLPINYSARDVWQFFSDCDITADNMFPIMDDMNMLTNRIMIKFNSAHSFQRAIQKNGLQFMGNPLEVVHSNEQMWLKCMAVKNNISNVNRANQNSLLGPYNQAVSNRNNVSYTTNMINNNEPFVNNVFTPKPDNNIGFCVRLRNLAYEAKSPDIQNFFKDIPLINLHIEQKENGRITGVAYAEFSNKNDYEFALQLHKSNFFERTLFIEPINKAEVVDLVKDNLKMIAKSSHMGTYNKRNFDKNFNNSHPIISAIHINGLPYTVRINDLISHLSRFGFNPKEIHILRKNGNPIGQAFVEFFNGNDVHKAITSLHGSFIRPDAPLKVVIASNPFEINMFLKQFDVVNWLDEYDPPCDTGNAKPNNYPRNDDQRSKSYVPRRNTPGDIAVNNFSNPSLLQNRSRASRIKITNIPEDACADDIIDLFKSYNCLAQSIHMVHSPSGKPIGEAILAFPTSALAQKALEGMNDKPYKNKKLHIVIHI
ncbi:unnamed protein product [Gordionus sp. m RMFG-2023]|uniref:RNA-binding protein 12-like n=1 Tax=Gordionus sp. m RMFG-2023 TaxID=3053472 RepID=UPI0030E3BAF8